MSDIQSIKNASRETIIEYARLLDLEFDRTDIATGVKKIWVLMREECDKFGNCQQCHQETGREHTFEECVARIHGRIDQLYQPKSTM